MDLSLSDLHFSLVSAQVGSIFLLQVSSLGLLCYPFMALLYYSLFLGSCVDLRCSASESLVGTVSNNIYFLLGFSARYTLE